MYVPEHPALAHCVPCTRAGAHLLCTVHRYIRAGAHLLCTQHVHAIP